MTVTFSIEYWTQPHERLWLVGHTADGTPQIGTPSVPLNHLGEGLWQATLHLPSFPSSTPYTYSYRLTDSSGCVLREEGHLPHHLLLPAGDDALFVCDHWRDRPEDAPAFSAAFCDILGKQPTTSKDEVQQGITFSVHAPALREGEQILLSGECEELGHWDTERALPLQYYGAGRWGLTLPSLRPSASPLSYKYLLRSKETGSIQWEEGANRQAQLPAPSAYPYCYVQDSFLRLPAHPLRTSGLVAPLFSLRSEDDWGIGDFGALREAIDFAAASGMHAVQLLPINDTTSTRDTADSYPYNAISVDALHPIYIDLNALPPLPEAEQATFLSEANALRALPAVDYPKVLALKERYLRRTFELSGKEMLGSEAFYSFYQAAASWLRPYALYCVLRDHFGTGAPTQWAGWEVYDADKATAYLDDPAHAEAVSYYYWLQFILDGQMQEVRSYAEARGIFLKGDLPIGVAPHSVDVWRAPHLFHTEQSAGAPPDDFAADGQNWGFPTYDWAAMQAEDFHWWKQRFEQQARYFHAFRIDHILGFFRIWEVPRTQHSGLLGHFHPALPYTLEEWQEILQCPFPIELLTTPLVHEDVLTELLGDSFDDLLDLGMLRSTALPQLYQLTHTEQADYDSDSLQRTLGSEVASVLQGLCTETALIADPYKSGHYHPRIALERSRLFARLPEAVQARWQAVSDDYYYVRHNELFRTTALLRLGALTRHTRLLLCAEDLGMIPASVPAVLDELQVLSLELERMPKTFTSTGWARPDTFPSRSVATTSTHDMPSLRGWWHSLSSDEQARYCREELLLPPTAEAPDEETIYRRIIEAHLASPAVAVLLPLADWMSLDSRLWLTTPEAEQINRPEDPHHYWSYRFPRSLKALQTIVPEWRTYLKQLITLSQRL